MAYQCQHWGSIRHASTRSIKGDPAPAKLHEGLVAIRVLPEFRGPSLTNRFCLTLKVERPLLGAEFSDVRDGNRCTTDT